MSSASIRVLGANDRGLFVRVVGASYGLRGMDELLRLVFDVNLEVQGDGCIGAFVNGECVGVGCFFDYGGVAWIGYVGVVSWFQRRGVGTLIMRELIARLLGRDVCYIRLDSTRRVMDCIGGLGLLVSMILLLMS